ncbi:MAG: hypothetical protein KGI50_00725 [Patescibacteria group bacterium]|nr:hypothetical protein [Patescibacteria group bacterium]MDE2438123.1 hypothetical protein [Patescibacteria group bacterium]
MSTHQDYLVYKEIRNSKISPKNTRKELLENNTARSREIAEEIATRFPAIKIISTTALGMVHVVVPEDINVEKTAQMLGCIFVRNADDVDLIQ